MTKTKSKSLKVYFRKVDHRARKHRETVTRAGNKVFSHHLKERTLQDLWMDVIPKNFTPLDWLRAWNDGYPKEELVVLYNSLHPDDNEQIALEEEDG